MIEKLIMPEKGDAEIISYVMVILIITLVVGMITSILIPAIGKQQSKDRFENTKAYIDLIDNQVNEIMLAPINSSSKISLDLTNLYLDINSDDNSIQIYSLTSSEEFYENNLLVKTGNKYTYRNNQFLYAGVEYSDINIINYFNIANTKTDLYFKKKTINQLEITTAPENN